MTAISKLLTFDQILEIDGKKLTKQYIQSLTKQERLDLVDPIFHLLRQTGWLYPDDFAKIRKSWKNLLSFQPNLGNTDLFNNSSLATNICKHFCHSFYLATERGKKTLLSNFADDKTLKRIIKNRLGLDWLDADKKGTGVNEAFNLSFKMIAIQGQRSMRLVNATSIFKPSVAKYLTLKYSQENDVIFDYSCGFGGRLLGVASANRQYIGTDPLTTSELEEMASFLELKKRYKLIDAGSEQYRGEEHSVDFSFSSPPYEDKEFYSVDTSQAYNNGDDYFYGVYWKKTLDNVRYMLKPGKWFGLNVLAKYDRMIEMAKERFGEPVELINLRTIKSHLTKNPNQIEKNEYVYMFRNNKS